MTWTKKQHERMEEVYSYDNPNSAMAHLLGFTRRLVEIARRSQDHANTEADRELGRLIEEWDGVGGVE